MEPYQIKTLSYIIGPIVMVILFFLYISSPVYSGYHIHTFQEHGAIFIRRDSFSIPTVKGSKRNDAYFGLGYAHCQDRQWGMEILRKTARGRLSEIFGKETLRVDQLVRELGISDVQETDVNEEIMASLQAYSRGVNQCFRNKMARSFELIIHSVSVEEWTELDSLAIFKLLSISFAASEHELNFSQFLPLEELAKLYGDNIYTAFNLSSPLNITNQIVDYQSELHQLFGENSVFAELTRESFMEGWVINGNYTNTSKPMVVNNLNAQASAPTLWYNSHLIYQTPAAGNVTNSGASIPGFPAIFSGLNDNLSWGFVNIASDSLSVSPLTLSKDGESYFHNGNWYPITIRNEKILVKNSEPITHVVRETESGIILGGTQGNQNSYLQLLWKGSNRNNSKINPKRQDWSHSIGVIQNLMEARNLEDIEELFKAKQTLIPIGLLVGTNDNQIAFIIGMNCSSSIAQTSSEKYLVHVSKQRGQRIVQLLNNTIQSNGKISTEQANNIMTDLHDAAAEQVVPKLLSLYTQHQSKFSQVFNRTNEMMQQLAGWDSRFTRNSIPASVFTSVILSISKKLFYAWNQKQNNNNNGQYFQSNQSLDEFVFSEINQWAIGQDIDASWCDHPAVVAVSGSKCLDLLFSAVDDAKNLLKKQGGEKLSEWQWGKQHIQINEHREFSKMPMLRKWFKLKEPTGGNKRTVLYAPEDSTFFSRKSTSYRSIYSLDRQDKSYFLIDTGIQESYLSSQYSDQMKHFAGKDKDNQLEVQYSLENLVEIKRDLNKLRENNIDSLLLVYDPKNDPKRTEQTTGDKKKNNDDSSLNQKQQSQDHNQAQLGDI